MDAQTYSKNEMELVLALLDLAPERRSAFLDEACKGQAALRARVLEIAENAEASGSFMGQPALDWMPETQLHGIKLGDRLDRYRLMEQIGEGGMGVVYVAEQIEPVRRKVALKVIKPGMDSKNVLARFDAERQALAMMDHPNIARILDAGTTEQGLPFFVMELVRGLPITQYCDQTNKRIRDRMALFIDVCRAIQHAHQKGIIHRDIKPSNVLVTLHDGTPIVKVIDFGVAKALHQPLSQHTIYTALNQVIGTPLYMSPEQLELSGLDIDTRTDIYSLGVLLYELVTGRTPFDQDHLMKSGFDEMRRIIREDEPPRPSLRVTTLPKAELSTAANKRGLDERSFPKSVANEIDWIILKALEKDRARRYESVSGFAEDIQRYMDNDPVLACPPSWRYRLGKQFRKHRVALSVVSTLLLGLTLGLTVSIWQWRRAVVAEKSTLASKLLVERKSLLANQRLELAEKTIDDMYTRFAQEWLSNQSGLSEVQKEFLEKALVTYDNLASMAPDENEPRIGAAIAMYRAGALHKRIGNSELAIKRIEECMRCADQVSEDNPHKTEFLIWREYARLLLNSFHQDRGETAKSTETLDKSWGELQKISIRSDLGENQSLLLARVLSTVAKGFTTKKARESEARLAADLSVAEARKLLKKSPPTFRNRGALADCLESKGTQCLWWGTENEACLKAYQEAVEILKLQIQDRPDHRGSIQSLSGVLQNLAIVLSRLNRADEVDAARNEQVKLLREYCKRFPDYPTELAILGDVLRRLANSEEKKGERIAAKGLWEEGLSTLNTMVERFPDNRMGRKTLAMLLNDYGYYQRENGNLERAREIFEDGRRRIGSFVEKYPADRELYVFQLQILEKLAHVCLMQNDYKFAADLTSECIDSMHAERNAAIQGKDGIDPRSYFGSVHTFVFATNILALSMQLLQDNKSITETERNVLNEHYSHKMRLAKDNVRSSTRELVRSGDEQKTWSSLVSRIDQLDSWKNHNTPLTLSNLDSRNFIETNAIALNAFRNHLFSMVLLPDVWSDVVLLSASSKEFCSDPGQLLALSRRGLDQKPDESRAKQAYAWALYRGNNAEECRRLLEIGEWNPEDGFILSMALATLGEIQLAKAKFDEASQHLNRERVSLEARLTNKPTPLQPNLETLLRLKSEAATIVQGAENK